MSFKTFATCLQLCDLTTPFFSRNICPCRCSSCCSVYCCCCCCCCWWWWCSCYFLFI